MQEAVSSPWIVKWKFIFYVLIVLYAHW
jgi:hypothetical protein